MEQPETEFRREEWLIQIRSWQTDFVRISLIPGSTTTRTTTTTTTQTSTSTSIRLPTVSNTFYFSLIATIYMPPQCSNYTLDTDATRLTNNTSGGGCDSSAFSTALWVRFSGGGATRLASTAPAINRCGTSAPGWLVSGLPTSVGTTTTGIVCYSWSSNICNWYNTISMTNCNSFYIFLLVSPPTCSLRYCTA